MKEKMREFVLWLIILPFIPFAFFIALLLYADDLQLQKQAVKYYEN